MSQTIDKLRTLLSSESTSPEWAPKAKEALTSALDGLVILEKILIHQGLNSKNSHIPSSKDAFPKKPQKVKGTTKKQGGQNGHQGACLEPRDEVDKVVEISVDRDTLPKDEYINVGFVSRQVIDIMVSTQVTEYRAEVLKNNQGQEFVAPFPEGVTEPIQYGSSVKSMAVYLSKFQLLPLARVESYFQEQFNLSVSKGSISNWCAEAAKKLLEFEEWARGKLLSSPLIHVDETGVKVNADQYWFHSLCTDKVGLFFVHPKRGCEAMDDIGILPFYRGILVHDHWKPYFAYDKCVHGLCNAHHLRELEWSYTEEGQRWAHRMKKFLLQSNDEVKRARGPLPRDRVLTLQEKYQKIIESGYKECPQNEDKKAQSKSRNLLTRLYDYEDETLLFLKNPLVPFTNNLVERAHRMMKVQQKISGGFRSLQGGVTYARIHSYLYTSRQHGVNPTEALRLLFEGQMPAFVERG